MRSIFRLVFQFVFRLVLRRVFRFVGRLVFRLAVRPVCCLVFRLVSRPVFLSCRSSCWRVSSCVLSSVSSSSVSPFALLPVVVGCSRLPATGCWLLTERSLLAKSIGYLVDWKFEYMEKRLRGLVVRLVAFVGKWDLVTMKHLIRDHQSVELKSAVAKQPRDGAWVLREISSIKVVVANEVLLAVACVVGRYWSLLAAAG